MPRKIYLIFFFACIAFCSLHAQSLYEFKYTFKGEKGLEYYNAFMVRYDDGTGYIRVNYAEPSTGEKYLVDMDMEESYDIDGKTGVTDSSLLYFTGINPVIISGDTTEGYDPDIYVFEKKEDGDYYDPLKVYSVDDNDSISEGDFTDVRLLSAEDLTEDFVSQYFFKDEPFYKGLFETTTRQLTNDEKAITLHVIIVANTNDPDIGTTCMLDKDRTLKIFTDLAEFMGIKLDVKTIFGNDYNKQNVQDAVTALKPAPQDIVIFYYSGHGFSKNDQYQYPYMELRAKSFQGLNENSINIEEVYNLIKQKGARVSLVMSDCCNTLPETPAAVSGEVALTRSSSLGWSLNNCLQLFLPTAPVAILMTAAKKGEMSAGNNSYGGFFTFNFRTSLLNFLSPTHEFTGVSWKSLIDEAQTQTVKKATNTLCNNPDGTRGRCVQHPVYKMW
ncbi:caspase family protein [Panacibacter ginsenosidivorans]|uniref:Caspase family protein n=1 Tax=Panacibacter ginsenosidivorans TaxID=1813871 RepID=A0A5B8VGT3_9BACT|nr:caspase family protein [Panacibacter ginsenosidivorans]QEC69518.1 caspase family protein [Panacibacter ginsenosidivorans]